MSETPFTFGTKANPKRATKDGGYIEIIYDESGLQIGATGPVRIIDDRSHDPRNHVGKNL